MFNDADGQRFYRKAALNDDPPERVTSTINIAWEKAHAALAWRGAAEKQEPWTGQKIDRWLYKLDHETDQFSPNWGNPYQITKDDCVWLVTKLEEARIPEHLHDAIVIRLGWKPESFHRAIDSLRENADPSEP